MSTYKRNSQGSSLKPEQITPPHVRVAREPQRTDSHGWRKPKSGDRARSGDRTGSARKNDAPSSAPESGDKQP